MRRITHNVTKPVQEFHCSKISSFLLMLRLLAACQTERPRGIFLFKKSCVFPRTKVSTSRPGEIKRPSKRRRTSDPFRPLGGCCCCGYRCSSSSSSCRTSDAGMIYVPCRDPSSHMFILAAPELATEAAICLHTRVWEVRGQEVGAMKMTRRPL